jgi:uncharacterized protein (DUF2384 family)
MSRIGAAIALGVLAVIMFFGFLNSSAAISAPATLGALLLTVGLPAVGALLLVRGHYAERARLRSRKEQLRRQGAEAEILRLAREHGGRLAAVEVAIEMGTSQDEAAEWLEALALRNQAEVQITSDGVLVYQFHDVRYLGGKESARDVLDA